jgi:hypothetical protein
VSTPATKLPFVTPGDITAAGLGDYIGGNAGFGLPPGPVFVDQPSGADVAALISTPPGAPPGFVGPPIVSPDVPTSPTTSTGSYDWGTFGGSILPGIYSRARHLTRTGKMLRRVEELGIRAIYRTLIGQTVGKAGVGTGARLLGDELVATGIPPPNPPFIVRAAYGFGRVVGLAGNAWTLGILALLRPTATASNDTTYQELLPVGIANEFGNYLASDAALKSQTAMREQSKLQELLQTGGLPPGNEIRLAPQDYGRVPLRSKLEQSVEDMLPQPLRDAINSSRNAIQRQAPSQTQGSAPPGMVPGQIVGVGPPAPSPSTSSSPTSSRSVSGPGRLPSPSIRWGYIGIGAGAIVAANYLLPRLFSSTNSQTTVAPVPGSAFSPIGSNAGNSGSELNAPTVGSFAVSGFGGAGAAAYCTPRSSGPRRKCLERAPVAWRSGSRRGKAAGTKCIRYAQRRTS